MSRGSEKEYLSYSQAQQNPFPIDWDEFNPQRPKTLGTQTIKSLDLELLCPFLIGLRFLGLADLHGKVPRSAGR